MLDFAAIADSPIDAGSVGDALGDDLEAAGGLGYISSLIDGNPRPTVRFAERKGGEISAKASLRRLIDSANNFVVAGVNGGGEIDNRIADLKALLAAHQEPGADVEFELLDEGQYQMKARGVTFIADYVRRERGVLVGELSVSIEGNAISAADFNFSSARTRSGHAKHLAERARTKKYDFAALLETLCQKIIGAERDGAPGVLLNELDEPEDDDELDVHGLTLLRRLPAIIFGDGAAGKSLFGLWVLGQLAKQGLAVMFADWEMDERVHRRRLGRLFGNDLPRITYVKCQRALPYEVDRLQRIIRNAGIDYAMLDSIGFAVDGPAEAHEVANRYARAVRQLGDIGDQTPRLVPPSISVTRC